MSYGMLESGSKPCGLKNVVLRPSGLLLTPLYRVTVASIGDGSTEANKMSDKKVEQSMVHSCGGMTIDYIIALFVGCRRTRPERQSERPRTPSMMHQGSCRTSIHHPHPYSLFSTFSRHPILRLQSSCLGSCLQTWRPQPRCTTPPAQHAKSSVGIERTNLRSSFTCTTTTSDSNDRMACSSLIRP